MIVDLQGNIFMPEGDVILSTGPLVGLGDHAVMTTLAKRFSLLGRKVYVHENVRADNEEVLELFWASNPFIDGITDRMPNAGYCRQGLFYEVANRFPIGSIEAIERAHGLPPPYGIAPYIAYQPKKFRIDLSEIVLVDFSAISSTIGDKGILEALRVMKGRFRNAQFVQILPPKWVNPHPSRIALDSIQSNSIYDTLDMMGSARAVVCSEAGSQSLAAAVRGEHDVYDLEARPEIVVTSTPKTFNSRGYTYRGVDYRVTCTGTPPGPDDHADYFFPHEITQHVYEIHCDARLARAKSRYGGDVGTVADVMGRVRADA